MCKGYHRQGKEFCSSHRIREECLDDQVVKYAESLRENWTNKQADLQRLYKQWSFRQTAEDIDELLMLRIQSAK